MAFIQKKIQEGIAKVQADMEARHRQDMAELERKVSGTKDQDCDKRLREAAQAHEQAQKEAIAVAIRGRDQDWERKFENLVRDNERAIEKAVAAAQKERDESWGRKFEESERKHQADKATAVAAAERAKDEAWTNKLRDAVTQQAAEITQKTRSEADNRIAGIRDELAQRYEKREMELKQQLETDKRATEAELRRQADRELARDKHDLEETYQAKARKFEEEAKAKAEESLKAREAELKSKMETDLRQERMALRSQVDEGLRTRMQELDAQVEKKVAQATSTEKAALLAEYTRKGEALEAKMQSELRQKIDAEKDRLAKEREGQLAAERTQLEQSVRAKLLHQGRFNKLSRSLHEPLFPFTAVVGQDKAKRALLLNAINPSVGGVVLWGPEGNAKFSMVLGFAELTAPIAEKLSRPGEKPRPWNNEERYLVGRLHYGKDTGSYLIDTQLDAGVLSLPGPSRSVASGPAGGGENASHRIPSLVGSLATEDEEAYHLITGLTLHVEIESPSSVEERLEIIRRNAEFRKGAESFRKNYRKEEEEIRSHVLAARDRLHSISVPPKLLTIIARMTLLDRQSSTMDVLLEQLARTNAAFEGKGEVEIADVMEAADLALLHRFTPREVAELERGGSSAAARATPAAAHH